MKVITFTTNTSTYYSNFTHTQNSMWIRIKTQGLWVKSAMQSFEIHTLTWYVSLTKDVCKSVINHRITFHECIEFLKNLVIATMINSTKPRYVVLCSMKIKQILLIWFVHCPKFAVLSLSSILTHWLYMCKNSDSRQLFSSFLATHI